MHSSSRNVSAGTRVAIAFSITMFSGCSGSGASSSAPAPLVATPTPAPSPTSNAAAAKMPLRGLVSMGSEDFVTRAGGIPDNGMEEINAHPAVYAGAVINLTWAQLEPSEGTFDDSAIDAALATIAAYNAKYPSTPVVAKLRVFAGQHVPAWVMAAAGGPITIDGTSGSEGIAAFSPIPRTTT